MVKTFPFHLRKDDYSKIIYPRKINLETLSEEAKNNLKGVLTKHKKLLLPVKIKGNSLVYDTEILIPIKKHRDKTNLLLVFGNPAVHSVSEGMFFSYENARVPGSWKEHRVWKAFQECGILELKESGEVDIHKPTKDNIDKINDYKRNCLLNTEYESAFNVFMLTYFSFPTPASGEYSGVAGIKKLFGTELFREIEKLEFQRFKGIVLTHNIKYIICFQKDSFNGIKEHIDPKCSVDCLKCIGYIDNAGLRKILLYKAPPTRRLLGKNNKEFLRRIVANIREEIGSFGGLEN